MDAVFDGEAGSRPESGSIRLHGDSRTDVAIRCRRFILRFFDVIEPGTPTGASDLIDGIVR